MADDIYAAAESHRKRRIRIALLISVLLLLPLLCICGLQLYLVFTERSLSLIPGVFCGMKEQAFLAVMQTEHPAFSLSDRVTDADGGSAYIAYCGDAEICGVRAPVLLSAEFRGSNGTLSGYSASLLCGEPEDEAAEAKKAAMQETLFETLPARFGKADADSEMRINPFYRRTGFLKLWEISASDFLTEGGFALLNRFYDTDCAALPAGYTPAPVMILDIQRESARGMALTDWKAFITEGFSD